jgi:choice-of-anchor B domain-containing protein
MSRKTTRSITAGGIALAAAACTAALFAHNDDPKEQDTRPAWVGPAFRAAHDAEPAMGFPAEGVELLAWLPVGEFPGSGGDANDCWGYTAPSGREYAIICFSSTTGFVDITDPTDPVIVETSGSNGCTWHDVKVFQHYAYVVSECGRGIQVIDMDRIDEGIVTLVREVTSGGQDSHNVAVDTDSGFLYRTGGSGNGLLIYDLNADPSNPTLVGQWPDRYVHDAQIVTYTEGKYAGKQIAFCNSGFSGGGTETGMDILDVTNKASIVQMSRYQYPNGAYSHQGWLDADKEYYYLNDESDESSFGFNTTTHIIDVRDLDNPVEVGTFTSGVPAIDHNLYMHGDLIFEANYRSGLRVFDASDRLNPVEVAYFDTYPENDSPNFNGLWSNYPFFPSGTVIGSDREKGLFIWRVRRALIEYAFPDGLPETIDPRGATVRVEISEREPGGLVEGTEMLNYSTGDGYTAVPLVNVGGDLYEATFPAIDCRTQVS